jgi:mono/diheme cytochrome c family protein/plastocyanin
MSDDPMSSGARPAGDTTGDSGVTPEPQPRPDSRRADERLPATRATAPVTADRFSAPAATHNTGGLTSARAAQIVRQSGSARWVAFLGVSIVALFVILYYFYETGVPIIGTQPRLEAQATAQQVTAVEQGYNLFEANCARCHGVNGEGGIGPVLNDQAKLFDHLNANYIKNVLTVGGRYVCGNPNSVMPVWADTNGGPLNYVQIQDLIAFIRAPSTQEFVVRNASLNEPIIGPDGKPQTFKGWVDPNYKPEPSSSPVPACWSGNTAASTPGPSATIPANATSLALVGQNFAFDKQALDAKAGTPFTIDFKNQDPPGTPHNVQIRKQDGTVVSDPPTIDGGAETTYVYDALPAGTYTFICKVHPIPAMTGTLTIK